MNTNEKELQKRKNTKHFIDVTKEMLKEHDLSDLSIRKIAEKAGFHNSTLYLYFENLDHLLMLASVSYFGDYSRNLASLREKDITITEEFLEIWDLFIISTLKEAKIFYNFFFGPSSNSLKKVMNYYYDLYPEEKLTYSKGIEIMYYGDTFQERCLYLLKPLIEEKDNGVTKENCQMLNDITINCIQIMLEQKCKDPSLDDEELRAYEMEMIKYINQIK